MVVRFLSAAMAAFLILPPAFGEDSNASIEQSRLFQKTFPSSSTNVSPDGMGLPQGDGTVSDDESFGAQQIVKAQEKIPQFAVSGDASVVYTSNVALSRSDTISDTFFVGDAAFSWTPPIGRELQLQVGARASIFRYNDTSELDFQSLGAGVAATWSPPQMRGVALIAGYAFTDLIDRHSDQLLQDHELSLAAQKIFVLGRSHAFSVAVLGSAGISDPFAQQRDQVGFALGYHLQLTRQLASDFGYRHSWYFYNDGRTDLNQVLSLGLHYYLTKWITAEAFLSGAFNYSNREVFKYNVLTAGGGGSLTIHF